MIQPWLCLYHISRGQDCTKFYCFAVKCKFGSVDPHHQCWHSCAIIVQYGVQQPQIDLIRRPRHEWINNDNSQNILHRGGLFLFSNTCSWLFRRQTRLTLSSLRLQRFASTASKHTLFTSAFVASHRNLPCCGHVDSTSLNDIVLLRRHPNSDHNQGHKIIPNVQRIPKNYQRHDNCHNRSYYFLPCGFSKPCLDKIFEIVNCIPCFLSRRLCPNALVDWRSFPNSRVLFPVGHETMIIILHSVISKSTALSPSLMVNVLLFLERAWRSHSEKHI